MTIQPTTTNLYEQIHIPTSICMNTRIDRLVAVTYFQRLILEMWNLEFLLHLFFHS